MTTKYDKQFNGKSLSDLQAMAPWIAANIKRFQEAGNVEGARTYARIQEALNRAIAVVKE